MSLAGTSFDIDESSDKSVAEQLRDALSKNAVRVLDLFNDWDTSGDGHISPKELKKALSLYAEPPSDEKFWDVWRLFDHDNSGYVVMAELHEVMKQHKDTLTTYEKAQAELEAKREFARAARQQQIDRCKGRVYSPEVRATLYEAISESRLHWRPPLGTTTTSY